MKSCWYISLTHKYPQSNHSTDSMRVIMSVQIRKNASIIEMTREATPKRINSCKLVYCGCGSWKDRHVLENIEKYMS